MAEQRFCCDGLCREGRGCPEFDECPEDEPLLFAFERRHPWWTALIAAALVGGAGLVSHYWPPAP